MLYSSKNKFGDKYRVVPIRYTYCILLLCAHTHKKICMINFCGLISVLYVLNE